MTKENIETAYRVAREHTSTIEEAVQVGFQMAINKEILFDSDGNVTFID